MNFEYDPKVDALSIKLSESPYHESDEVREGVIFDYDADGKIVRIELLNASSILPGAFSAKSGVHSKKLVRRS